jgi:tight adherence protein B
MKYLLLFISVFAILLLIIELVLYSYRNIKNPNRDNISKRLKSIDSFEYRERPVDLLKSRDLSEVPFLNALLMHTKLLEGLEALREQARAKYPLGFFLILSAVLALAVFLICLLFEFNIFLSLFFAAVAIPSPFMYLKYKRNKRLEKFVRQLPDALDLICRALKAGHDLSSGMKMVTEEFKDPIAQEFEDTINEINFGLSTKDALTNMSKRVNCADFNYFVVAVGLQRETGGNLAEIIESISKLIRERFKFYGRVKAFSAEGRLSAVILIAMPIVVFILMTIMNPEYMRILIESEGGRKIGYLAIVMMCIGVIIIRKIIKVRI